MASRESARSSQLMAKLDSLRNAPASVVVQSAGSSVIHSAELLNVLKNFLPATHHLSPLVDICLVLQKTTLKIGNMRYNRWGKLEIFLPEMAQQFKALKATPEEIETLAWVNFFPYGEEQEECCRELTSLFLSDKKPSAGIRLLDFSIVKDNSINEVNAHSSVSKKQIVYGKWQLIRYVPSSLPENVSSSSPSSEVVDVNKVKANSTKSDLTDKEPPKKRTKKSSKEKDIISSSSSSSPISSDAVLDDLDQQEPVEMEK